MFRSGRSPERFLATILFTDIVGSSDLVTKLGDRAWRRLLAAHHAAVRRELRRFSGREVDTAGDGFFATFGQPAQAVRAADAIVAAVAKLGVSIRAGLHTGEAEAAGQKIGGIAVHIASRVMSAAGPGEILVSGTLRELVAGSGLDFSDRGAQELKGIPGEWHLWALVRQPTEADQTAIGSVVRVPEPRTGQTRRRKVAIAGAGVTLVLIGSIGGVMLLGRASQATSTPSPGALLRLGPNTVVILDQTSGVITDVRDAGGVPASIGVSGDQAWVGAVEASLLVRLDRTDASAAQTLGRVGRPTAIALGNGLVWVADAFDNILSILDATNGEERDSFPGVHVRRIAYGFDALWGTDDVNDRLLRFDRQTGAVVTQVPLPAGSYPTALAIGTNAIWVAEVGNQTLARIDPASGTIVAAGIALRGQPEDIAANASDVWVTSRASDLLMRVDPSTNTVTTTLSVCDGPSGVAINESGIWLACTGPGQVWHIRRDGTVLNRIEVGGRPSAIAISDDRVWVTVATP